MNYFIIPDEKPSNKSFEEVEINQIVHTSAEK